MIKVLLKDKSFWIGIAVGAVLLVGIFFAKKHFYPCNCDMAKETEPK